MPRIYIVTDRIAGTVTRYVRAHSLNAAIRAVANETFLAAAATNEELFQAVKAGEFEVLDAMKPEQVDMDDEELAERKPPKRAAAAEPATAS